MKQESRESEGTVCRLFRADWQTVFKTDNLDEVLPVRMPWSGYPKIRSRVFVKHNPVIRTAVTVRFIRI